ncbi:MAG: aminoacetone oxidase family FAD-binding enzyme [Candidatus Paceibacterota bacterium]
MNTPLKSDNKYDVIVIGGGPSGMMTAVRASTRGARVLLLEKNPDVGKKLLITGGGRCNVTNAEFDNRKLLANYKDASKFLFSAFAQHTVEDSLDFFHSRNMETKIEDNKRVFPVSNSARSVYDTLKNYLKENKVTVLNNAEVNEILFIKGSITGLLLKNGETLTATSYVLSTGGKSRPDTGSTGDGFRWLQTLGHKVIEPDASLVPIALNDNWVSKVTGTTLTDIKISIYQNEKKVLTQTGKILFTHVGVSGPTILNLSKTIGELLDYGSATIKLDLFPTLDEATLDDQLIELFQTSNKKFKNSLSPLLPTALASALVTLSHISPELEANSIKKDDRKKLVKLFKALPLHVKGLLGTDKAIVTSGGVDLKEVNFKTMQSRLYPNLYLVGDVLNIDRPSGGYSLQLCWTTGFVAGNSVPF